MKGNSLLETIHDYVVVDLETTGLSPDWDEIIESGAIKIRNGKIIDTYNTLVKPTSEISDFIAELTGITNEMLFSAPPIESVLPEFLAFLGDAIVIGHNVNFDINFLYDNIKRVLGRDFDNNFIDVMRLSRRVFKGFHNHKLITLASNLKATTMPSHRALPDCNATHEIYEHIRNHIIQNGIDITITKKATSFSAKGISATTTEFDEEHPFFNKVVVFTGALSIPRKEAMQLVVDVGGKILPEKISKQTNFLVLGNNDYCKTIKDDKSSKQKNAEVLILSGQDIQILSENVFFDILKDNDFSSKTEKTLPAKYNVTEIQKRCMETIYNMIRDSGDNCKYLRLK